MEEAFATKTRRTIFPLCRMRCRGVLHAPAMALNHLPFVPDAINLNSSVSPAGNKETIEETISGRTSCVYLMGESVPMGFLSGEDACASSEKLLRHF
jgi:hypothetical protein